MLIYKSVYYFYNFVIYLLFARALMSWFVRDYSNPVVKFIYELSEPILMPMRTLFDRMGWNRGMIDFSFLATFFAIEIIARIVLNLIGFLGI